MRYKIRAYADFGGELLSERFEDSELGPDAFSVKVCSDEFEGEDIDTTKCVMIIYTDFVGREECIQIHGYPVDVIGY